MVTTRIVNHTHFPSGEHLFNLLPLMIERKKMVQVLKFIADLTKTNSTYVDQQLLSSIIEQCFDVRNKQTNDEVGMVLQLVTVLIRVQLLYPDLHSTGKSLPHNYNLMRTKSR